MTRYIEVPLYYKTVGLLENSYCKHALNKRRYLNTFFLNSGSRKCECGLLGVCFDPIKHCNCDSGHDDWLWDGGEITQKEYLPVRALHFGDTGNPLDKKEGRYSLGPLECDGDVLFDNVVTFR